MRTDLIKSKLKEIDESINLVRENLPQNYDDFLKMGLKKDGIYKRIEAAIQEIISICSIINADLELGIPANKEDIIIYLVEENIITEELGKKIKELKGFRNFLVHRYGKIEDRIAFNDIKKGLDDFIHFKKEIKTLLLNY